MSDRIDSKIEDHRRDPDPHPRWRKQIDEVLADHDARIDALNPTGGTLALSNDTPTSASGNPSSAGSAPAASRSDHRHTLELPSVVTPGTYGAVDKATIITIDATGRVTNVSTPDLVASGGGGSGYFPGGW